jgi:hypothetical protein
VLLPQPEDIAAHAKTTAVRIVTLIDVVEESLLIKNKLKNAMIRSSL